MATTIYQFPAQKKLLSEKTEQWGKDCMDAGMTISLSDTSKIRKTKAQKKINYELIAGVIDETDIETAFNPMGIKGVKFPAKIQNYPIEISKFNVLKGEESKRRFDYRLRSVNEDAVSEKEFQMKTQVLELINQDVLTQNYDEETVGRRLRDLQHYQQYEYQDFAEKMGTRILDYFWYTQKIKEIFSDAFYDVLIGAEEIYACDIIHGEPIVSKKHTLNVSTFGGSNSHKIEDYDIIVDDTYVSVGAVIDELWDELKPEEIDKLETGARENRLAGNIVLAGPMQENTVDYSTSQLITIGGTDINTFGGEFDSDGNIRRTAVYWRSRRKMGELTYYDEDGNEQQTTIDENFPIDQYKNLGWTVKWFWINEWWSGLKVGSMYKKIGPLPRIGSKFSNPSICMPPIIGTIYNVSGSPGVSLMDRVKPYKYLYNVYMRRTELASARNKGVFAELDLAETPDGWDEELRMMYAEANGYMITDSFKEGKKGQSMGKLIGTIKQRASVAIDLDSSNVIRANLELARYVKNELGEIAGITPQREGAIDNRETYGGIERSVTQSSHITEEWFRLHDNTKVRVLELLLETAKYAWRNATGPTAKKLQYVDDGLISHMFTVDGRVLAETEYAMFISNGQSDTELIQTIKNLALTLIQNDKITIKELFTIYRDSSISSQMRKLEDSELQRNQREDDIRKEQYASQEKIAQEMNQIEQMKLEQEERLAMAKIESDIYIKELEISSKLAEGQINSKNPEDADKYQIELDKLKETSRLKREEFALRKLELEKKITSDEKIAFAKIKSDEKVGKMRALKPSIKK